ncbi:MAG: YceD family protein [Streptosporangiaceae bacterium]
MKRLDPRGPLVFDTRTLGPGLARVEDRTVPAPPGLGVELVSIPAGAGLLLHVQLEGVVEGTLVTATARAPLAAECARCLDPFTSATEVRLQELFAYEAGSADADSYLQDGDLLDLEPALRDALVLALPLAPLCSGDCPGLCVECGIRLADAGPGHGHAAEGAQQRGGPMPDGIPVPELRNVPELGKER